MQKPFKEECFGFEVMLDTCRGRLDVLQAEIGKFERKWNAHSIVWDDHIVKQCKFAPLHAVAQIMSK